MGSAAQPINPATVRGRTTGRGRRPSQARRSQDGGGGDESGSSAGGERRVSSTSAGRPTRRLARKDIATPHPMKKGNPRPTGPPATARPGTPPPPARAP